VISSCFLHPLVWPHLARLPEQIYIARDQRESFDEFLSVELPQGILKVGELKDWQGRP